MTFLLDDFKMYMYKYYYNAIDTDDEYFQEFFNSDKWLILFISKFIDTDKISTSFTNYLLFLIFENQTRNEINISNSESERKFLKNICRFIKENDYKSISKEAQKINQIYEYMWEP